jgi:hypothetical protein
MDAHKVLTDPEACEKAFDIEIDAQNVIELVEFLTAAAIRSEQEVVELPIATAAAAVLVLNGVVTRPANRPRKTWRQKRADMRLRVRRRKPVDDPMILWARHRFREIKSAAEANGQHISAYDARLQASAEAKVEFKSPLSREQIADRSRRPARYAPSDIQPT